MNVPQIAALFIALSFIQLNIVQILLNINSLEEKHFPLGNKDVLFFFHTFE